MSNPGGAKKKNVGARPKKGAEPKTLIFDTLSNYPKQQGFKEIKVEKG